MDLNGFLRLVFLEKNDITFGVIVGLLLIVLILLLIRSVLAEKARDVVSTRDGSATLDSASINHVIEGALKKALGENPAAVAVVGAATSGGASTDAIELKKALNEREAKISALMSDLEAIKGQMEKPGGAGAGGDTSALQAKVKELQTKLAEYEIIEDDIADLSLYKEENRKLKDEVERLRAAVETAKTQVQAAQVATSAVPLVDAVQTAQNAVVITAPAAPTAPVRPPPEPFKLDTNDEVMGEFAQALASTAPKALDANLISGAEIADPKAAIEALLAPVAAPQEAATDPFGTLDTEKMLAEVASLKESAVESSTSILDEQLDTDRLMAEMGMTEAPAMPAAVAPAVAIAAAAIAPAPIAPAPIAPAVVNSAQSKTPPNAPPEAPEVPDVVVPVDDLLAEFKDTDLLKGTKGS